MRGGSSDSQRAIYQPFNLLILVLAIVGMAASWQISRDLLWIAALCLPVTLLAAFAGSRLYSRVSPATFQRVVLALLLASGVILVGQALVGR
jgi:uncharacterized protein